MICVNTRYHLLPIDRLDGKKLGPNWIEFFQVLSNNPFIRNKQLYQINILALMMLFSMVNSVSLGVEG